MPWSVAILCGELLHYQSTRMPCSQVSGHFIGIISPLSVNEDARVLYLFIRIKKLSVNEDAMVIGQWSFMRIITPLSVNEDAMVLVSGHFIRIITPLSVK
jgi:hypothetical protein